MPIEPKSQRMAPVLYFIAMQPRPMLSQPGARDLSKEIYLPQVGNDVVLESRYKVDTIRHCFSPLPYKAVYDCEIMIRSVVAG